MTSIIDEIKNRRVLPAVGVYAASCWVLIEILDRLVERYLLSPYLTDIVFWGLYTMIPAVIMVAWSHGKPGKDETTRLEKVGVPLNLVATLALLFSVFGGKDLGAAASMVEVANEEGEIESRLVASESYLQRMAIFFFRNRSGDPELDWVQYGISDLLLQDLQQNPFISAISPWWASGHVERMKQAGFDDGLNVPRSLLREITADANRQFFVEGDVDRNGPLFKVTVRLWDSHDLTQVAVIEDEGPVLTDLADRISREIREALDIPDTGNRVADLPLSDTYGDSLKAFELYTQGMNSLNLDNDSATAITLFEAALEEDPDFVQAWFVKGISQFQSGNMPAAQASLQRASELDYRLPEKDRVTIKLNLYRISGQVDKAIALASMNNKVNNDAHSLAMLATFLVVDGQLLEAKRVMAQALEKDPLNLGLYLQLAALERSTGNTEASIAYIEQYLQERPDDEDAILMLGDTFRDDGQLEEAQSYYQQAQVIAENLVVPTLRLSNIARRRGNIEQARELLEQARVAASTPLLAMQVYGDGYLLEYRLGRISAAIEQIEAQYEAARQALPPFSADVLYYTQISAVYMEVQDFERARQLLEEGKSRMQPPMNQFLDLGSAILYSMTDELDKAEAALERATQVIEQFGVDAMRFQIDFLESGLLSKKGQFKEAAALRKSAVEEIRLSILGSGLTAQMPLFYAELADAQIDAQMLEEATFAVKEGMRLDPNHPQVWYQQARLQEAKGQKNLAVASLQYALAIWADADPEYSAAQEAREMLSTLTG